MGYKDYTEKATSMEHWLTKIAPNYFDFDTEELYRVSQFGYINEVMNTIENDTHTAVSIARREFYPNTAKYLKSFYKMAALQEISYPMANPAIATAVLILKESDIIQYGTPLSKTTVNTNTDSYQFVLDNTLKIYAGNIPFMLDYPIIIMAKKSKNIFKSGNQITSSEYAYTVRYDTSKTNSMNNQHSKYIKSRVFKHGSQTLLLIKVAIRQCSLQHFSANINKSPILNNISLDFSFSGDMCNFEAFYTEAYAKLSNQLTKLPINSNPKRTNFCMWQMIDANTLRLSFPNNAYFNPKYNSIIDVDIYTTLGENGNFAQYNAPLAFTIDSIDYPYNNLISLSGKITGSSIGGYSYPSIDDFKSDVIAAYATNKTFTTDSDLQYMFDSVAMNSRNRIIFSKRRDDVFERLYGAYVIMKDLRGYALHTNSITAEIISSDFPMAGDIEGDSIIIKAGVLWRYHSLDVETWKEPVYLKDDEGNLILDKDGLPQYIFIYEKDEDGNDKIDIDGNKIHEYFVDEDKLVMDELTGEWIHPFLLDESGNKIPKIELEDVTGYRDGRDYIANNDIRKFMVYPSREMLTTFIDQNNDYCYTNPFLIRVNTNRNVVAFYQNTFDTTVPMDLSDVNNESIIQFNMTGLNVYRNAIAGENFYKFTVSIQPSVANSDLSKMFMIEPEVYGPELREEGEFKYNIRALTDGIVERFVYIPGALTEELQQQNRRPGSVYMIVRYKDNTLDPKQIPKYVYDRKLYDYLAKIIKNHNPNLTDAQAKYEAEKLVAIRVSGGVEYGTYGTNARTFIYKPWYGTNLRAGDTFKGGSIIAYAKPLDTGALRVVMEFMIKGNIGGNYYIPMTLESYNAENDSYQYSAYISTSDKITDKDMLLIDDGFFDKYGNDVETTTIDPEDCRVRISTFIKYDDITDSHNVGTSNGNLFNFAYCLTHTFTNSYVNSIGNEFDLLKPFTFIRSVMNYQNDYVNKDNWLITLRELPLIRASWMRNTGNVLDVFRILRNNHDYIEEAYDLLENNFTIDMKLYNTYGRSRYFNIGLKLNSDMESDETTLTPLDSVNVKFKFGVKLNSLVDEGDFTNRFTEFIRLYIEAFNKIENMGQDIHITDLITQLNIQFADELEYLEFYGINDYSADSAQIIETWSVEDINALGYNKYIPEFINLFAKSDQNDFIPWVDITYLK